jgi:hypothetical protein
MDKQELPINNPADRLYVILTRMKGNDSSKTVKEVFCNAIEMDANDENFIQGIAESFTLLKNMKEQVEKYFPSRKHTACLVMIEDIKKFIFSVVKNNEERWIELSYPTLGYRCDLPNLHLLDSYVYDFEEINLNKDSLNNLIDDIKSWIKEIEESQLDEDIRQFFIHKLIEIKHLLEKYYYHGSFQIKKEIYATMVEIGICQENLPEDKKEENTNFFKASFEKLSQWAGVVNAPMNTVVIADKLLPIISQTAELVGNTVKHLLPPGI